MLDLSEIVLKMKETYFSAKKTIQAQNRNIKVYLLWDDKSDDKMYYSVFKGMVS